MIRTRKGNSSDDALFEITEPRTLFRRFSPHLAQHRTINMCKGKTIKHDTLREHEGMQMMSSSAAMLVMQSQTVSQDESQHGAECGSVAQFLGSCPPSSEVVWKHNSLDPLELIVGKLTPVGTDVHSVVAQNTVDNEGALCSALRDSNGQGLEFPNRTTIRDVTNAA